MPGKGGHDAFELRIERGDEVLRWRIDEQEGISTTPNTVPDFVIRRLDERAKPIAIYLDGFQYHASVQNPNMADDIAKRNGALTEYVVWNMTWDDVAAFHKAAASEGEAHVGAVPLLAGTALTQAKAAQAGRSGRFDYATVNHNPVVLLLDYLASPEEGSWRELALSTVAGALAGAGERGTVATGDVESVLISMARGGQVAWSPVADFAAGAITETARGLRLGLLLRLDDPRAERWTVVASLPDDLETISNVYTHRPRWQDWPAMGERVAVPRWRWA